MSSLEDSNKQNSFTHTQQKVDLHYFQKRVGKLLLRHLGDGSIQTITTANSLVLCIGLRVITEHLYCNTVFSLIEQLLDPKLSLHLKQGIDKDQQSINHDDTIRGLLNAAVRKIEMLKQEQCAFTQFEINQILVGIVNIHPVLEYAIVGFVRAKAARKLAESATGYRYVVLGNEEKILGDYSATLRNTPMQLIADAFGLDLKVEYAIGSETYSAHKPIMKVHVCCDKSNKTVLKYEPHPLAHSQSAPVDHPTSNYHLNLNLNRLRGSRQNSNDHTDNSRMSIGSQTCGAETSRTKPSKTCPNCGKIKTERFCQCRKTSTPKNSQKGSNSTLKTIDVKSTTNLMANRMKKCRKCKGVKHLFMEDEYCGECIGLYNIRRCTGCNELYETACNKCR